LGERAAAVARVRAEQQGLSSRLERRGASRLRTARAEREVLARALEKQEAQSAGLRRAVAEKEAEAAGLRLSLQRNEEESHGGAFELLGDRLSSIGCDRVSEPIKHERGVVRTDEAHSSRLRGDSDTTKGLASIGHFSAQRDENYEHVDTATKSARAMKTSVSCKAHGRSIVTDSGGNSDHALYCHYEESVKEERCKERPSSMENAARSAHALVALALAQKDAEEGHASEREDGPATSSDFPAPEEPQAYVKSELPGDSIDDSLTGDIRAIEERILGRLRR